MKTRTPALNSIATLLLLFLFVVGCNLTSNNDRAGNSNATNSNAAGGGKGGNTNAGARSASDNSRANGNTGPAADDSGGNQSGSGAQGGGEAGRGADGAATRGGAQGGSRAGDTISITIVNDANYDIYRLFMSPTREQNWGPDQLGDQIIRKNGGQYTLRNVPCDNYDVRLVDEDNDECVMRNVSFCGEDRIWRISNDELLRCQGYNR